MSSLAKIPAELNLVMTQGVDFTVALTVTEAGAPYDFTSATLSTAILDFSNSQVATNFTVSVASNVITLALSDTATTALGTDSFRWRLRIVDGGDTSDVVAGVLSVVPPGVAGVLPTSASATLNFTVSPTVDLEIAGGVVGPTGPTGPQGAPGVVAATGTGLTYDAPTQTVDLDPTALAADTALTSAFVPIGAVPTGGATGQVLAKVSGANYDTAWASGLDLLARRAAPGFANRGASEVYGWPLSARTAGSTKAVTANRLYVHTALFASSVILDRIRLWVIVAAASAGQLARLGCYSTDQNLVPQTLVRDFGTVDISSTGIKSITGLNESLTPGIYAFVVVCQQNCSLEFSTLTGPGMIETNLGSDAFANQMAYVYANFTFGSLPSTAPALTNWEGNTGGLPQVLLQLGWSAA